MRKINIEQIRMTPIGYIDSCYKDKFGTPRQSGLVKESFGKIVIYPQFQPEASLEGISEFSHLWVLFLFHQNSNVRFHAKVHPPRLLGKSLGLFATRSPHRPNPIGLSLVKLEKVESSALWVSQIDLIQGTPVLDVKPYLPFVESVSDAKKGWTEDVKSTEISVEFSENSEEMLKQLMKQKEELNNFRELIIQTLVLDPRPVVYRGYEDGGQSPYRTTHALRILDYDIHFEFSSKNTIRVLSIHNIFFKNEN